MPSNKEGIMLDLGPVLVQQQYVTEADFARAASVAQERDITIEKALLDEGTITRTLLGQAIAEYLKVPYADLQNRPPGLDLIKRIPEDIARSFMVVLMSETEEEAVVATDERDHPGMTAALETVFGTKKLARAFAFTEDIMVVLRQYQKPLAERLGQVTKDNELPAPKIVEEIFRDALGRGTSDVHIEPRRNSVLVRFRIDGVLHDAAHLDRVHYLPMLNRIKVLSQMRLDDHASAQDGAIRYDMDNEAVDIRVSIVPTVDGEKIVLRLLVGAMRSLTLADLGLGARHWEQLQEAVRKPFGMVLVTGPTGSGKTTTLYAVMKAINNSGINITTIEDPVEYRIEGANQIQVNTHAGLTFGDGLRAIVRQNPDAILVGEIRDPDTAEIAINSALTGHLLFSTFHANDAGTAIPRLLELDVEPFLVSSTLELIIAQRLVRRICENCRAAVVMTAQEQKQLPVAAVQYMKAVKNMQIYRGKGCSNCNGIGYRGRVGLFEFLVVSRALRDLILKRPSSQEVWALASKEGATSLLQDGLDKVRNGLTTLEEVFRVASPQK